jgi:hypothetical protein
VGAWGRYALRWRSYGLGRFYKLIAAFLALVPLFPPGVTALDALWMSALWALHSVSSDKNYFYSNRMLKYFYSNRTLVKDSDEITP